MQAQVDAGLFHNVERRLFEAIGIEGGGKDDGMGLRMGMEVEHPPPRPPAPERFRRADRGVAVGLRRIDAQPLGVHAIDDLHGQAAHGDLGIVVHVVQYQHHAPGRQAAEVGIALHQDHRRAVARGGDRRRDAGRTAPHDHYAGGGDDRHLGFGPGHEFRR